MWRWISACPRPVSGACGRPACRVCRATPYAVLGVTPDMPLAAIRKVWRDRVRASHPDRLMARGVPEEALKLAEARLIAANRAWEEIQDDRAA